jgi:hypothetical protein
MRRAALLLAVAVLAGCGGGSKVSRLYDGGEWQVTLEGQQARVLHLVDGKWTVAAAGVKIQILGPKPNKVAPNPPQVAVSITSKAPLKELFLWIDGNRLVEKGGGTATDFTMYGAPNALDQGTHTAVAYARTATSGSAIAWKFDTGKPPA